MSAQKGRLVADLIRGKPVDQALNILSFSPKKGATIIKKVFEASANIVEGNLGGAANAIERIMGLTIPVIIDLFLSILGLSGLPKKVMGVIKRVGGKLNALIDKLLLKVVGVIKKMFGKGKKGGGKKDGKKRALDGSAAIRQRVRSRSAASKQAVCSFR